MKTWLGLHDLATTDWGTINSVEELWKTVIHKRGDKRKAMATLAMLVSWEVWKERNARVFTSKAITPTQGRAGKIKDPVRN